MTNTLDRINSRLLIGDVERNYQIYKQETINDLEAIAT